MKTREKIMKSAIKSLNKEKLMVGTGTPSLSETIKLTKYADSLGYKIALVLPPYYYKPITNNGLISWYEEIHFSLKNQRIKLFFYNFPQLTGLEIPVEVISQLNKKWPNRFSGIKDSSGDLTYCRNLKSKIPNLKVFPSSEVSLGEAKRFNFSGCISATVNQTGSLCQEFCSNESATTLGKIKTIRETIASDSLVSSIKYLVAMRTREKSWENVVLPFQKLTTKRKAILDELYKEKLS
jgi:4-hydroxy-tetrahydrodipicolinate synthase